MAVSFPVLLLLAVGSLSLFLTALSIFFWRLHRADRSALWLAAWLGVGVLFTGSRLLQYAPLSEQVYRLLPHLILTSACGFAWIGYELSSSFIGYRPRDWEQVTVGLMAAVPLVLGWTTDLVVTPRLVLRTVILGGQFWGTQMGPLYLPAVLLIVAIGTFAPIRLLRATQPDRRHNRLLAITFGLLLVMTTGDMLTIPLNIPWLRLSDLSYLPVALMMTYIELSRIAALYRGLDLTVQTQTAALRVANEELRTEVGERKQAQDALRASEEKYRTLVEHANDGIAIIQDARVKYVNPQLAEIRGEPVEEILDKPFAEYIHPEERAKIGERYAHRLAGLQEPATYETALIRKDGRRAFVEFSIGPIPYCDKPAEIVIVRDVSARRETEQALQRQLREMTVLMSVSAACWESTDPDELIERVTGTVSKALFHDNCGVLLADEQLRTWRAHPSYQGVDAEKMARVYPVSTGVAGKVISECRTIRLGNIRLEPAYEYDTPGIISELAAPIVVGGKVFGCLNAESRVLDAFDAYDERMLETIAGSMATAIEKMRLLDELKRAGRDLAQAYDTTLEGWAKALELRDKETEGHSRRVTSLTIRLARCLGIGDADLVHIRRGVLLHDIGKMGISDRLLRKPGPLTEDEWCEMRKHPAYAYGLLRPITFLHPALGIPYCHHERWDGSGYPRGLKGRRIPLGARMFSVVDVYDALLYDRPYRKAWPRRKVLDYLRQQSGVWFDPHVVDAFLGMLHHNPPLQPAA